MLLFGNSNLFKQKSKKIKKQAMTNQTVVLTRNLWRLSKGLFNHTMNLRKHSKKLHLGDRSIMEHNSKFRLLMSQTGMKDSLALMDLYQETLPWGLQSLII
jgi:hypothetical protein